MRWINYRVGSCCAFGGFQSHQWMENKKYLGHYLGWKWLRLDFKHWKRKLRPLQAGHCAHDRNMIYKKCIFSIILIYYDGKLIHHFAFHCYEFSAFLQWRPVNCNWARLRVWVSCLSAGSHWSPWSGGAAGRCPESSHSKLGIFFQSWISAIFLNGTLSRTLGWTWCG